MSFAADTKLEGPKGANAVLIAGSIEGQPGINELNPGLVSPLAEGTLRGNHNLFVFGNSQATQTSPNGSNLSPANPDPIEFDFKFSGAGKGSVDQILANFGADGSLPATASSGGSGMSQAFIFSPTPIIDVQFSDAAALLRQFLKSVLKEGQAGVVGYEPAPREGLGLEGESGYFGPYLTTGYEYLTYLGIDPTTDEELGTKKVFPRYIDYVQDQDGNWVMKNLFEQP
jgi:hypothetical protein